MTVINSNVGSDTTLTRTSLDVTVKGKDSVTVSITGVALVSSSLGGVASTVHLSRTAMHAVHRGLF